MAKHTAGPWIPGCMISDDCACNCTAILAPVYMGSIASVSVDNGKSVREGGNDCPPLEEAKANARLIAAAPELLEALKWLHELCIHANPGAFDNGNLDATGSIDEGDVLASKLIGGAQSAIARAEGH